MFKALRHWLTETGRFLVSTPSAAAVVALAFVGGALAGIGPRDRVYDYMWRDPSFCDDCHVHDYANQAYDRSIHAGMTTCHDCHLVPISHYPRNLYVTVFDPPQGPEDIHPPEVETVICTRCHSKEADDEPLTGPMSEELRKRVVKVDDSPLHRVHMSSKVREPGPAKGGVHGGAEAEHEEKHESAIPFEPPSWDEGVIGCADCHGSEANRAHQFTAQRESCERCHEEISFGAERMAGADCRQCHLSGFLGDVAGAQAAASPAP